MINKPKNLPWSASIAQWLRQFDLQEKFIIKKKGLDALSLKNRTIRDDLITECDHFKVEKGDELNIYLSKLSVFLKT